MFYGFPTIAKSLFLKKNKVKPAASFDKSYINGNPIKDG